MAQGAVLRCAYNNYEKFRLKLSISSPFLSFLCKK
jgi:hypothetical protein